ncbi:MAG: helix-turn-helix domain-containing protein [Oscillospiraceae bacterium]|jgi:transcriptional regulator with XRE-family HTH domain|nr:helix-turn-helix domain-containing protein [Oscillospiraceae bacterium]
MFIKIGERIKQLRRKRDVTQERLAEYLGITPQAVSRWESELAYPDIELLPAVADFFGTSVDELLGVDAGKREAEINSYHTRSRALWESGKYGEAAALFREGVSRFPSDDGLWSELANSLSASQNEEELREAVTIYERVLSDGNPSPKLRASILGNLCLLYAKVGERERAIDLARTLPHIYESRVATLPLVLDGEEREAALKSAIFSAVDLLCVSIYSLASGDTFEIGPDPVHKAETAQNRNCKMAVEVRDGDKSYSFDFDWSNNRRNVSIMSFSPS